MHTVNFEQEFNKLWNKSNYQQKKKILREINGITNRKEAERKRKKAYLEAVRSEKIRVVKKMLKRGVNVNEKDGELGNTALPYAMFTGNFDLVNLLLNYGADPFLENKKGYNAIDAARLIGKKEIVRLLVSKKH
jgi:ankyrin repeat protein